MPTASEIDALRYGVTECAENCQGMVAEVAAAYKNLNETIEEMLGTLWELQYAIGQVKGALDGKADDVLDNEWGVVLACEELDDEIEDVKFNLENDSNDIDRRTKAEIEKLLNGDTYKGLDNLLKILGTIS